MARGGSAAARHGLSLKDYRLIVCFKAGKVVSRYEEGFGVVAGVVKLAEETEAKANIPLLIQDWLSKERNGRWFMILNCADDQEVSVCLIDHLLTKKSQLTFW